MGRKPVSKGLISLFGALITASSVILVVVATSGAERLASGAMQPTAASNRAAARMAAVRLLGALPLPAGATEVGTDPESSSWLRSSVSGAPATPDVVDLHRFWRVAGDPKTVIDWIKAHHPAGTTVSTTGIGAQYGTPVMWSITLNSPAVPVRISEDGVGVGVTAARGGGTAMRADAFAVWVIPRPAGEVVPSGVHAVAIFVDRFGGRAFPAGTVTAPVKVRQLVALINSRQLEQPGPRLCPVIGSFTRLVDLRFLPAMGETPLARAVEDGCGGLSFSVRGRNQPGLAEATDLTDLLWKLSALPVCRAPQLRPSATVPTRTPSPVEVVAQLYFRNVSATVCSLKGFAYLRLRDPRGRPLPTRVTNSRVPARAVILAPRDSAWVGFHWPLPGRSCKAAVAATIDVALPKVPGHFRVDVASHEHPVAPCEGKVTADAIG
jgi:hypothetical protein